MLELACGKGEYTVGMAQHYPENGYIGVDIKGLECIKGRASLTRKNLIMQHSFEAE